MNVTSVAGNTSGSTLINVDPTLTGGNSYKYKVAANPTLPICGQECKSGYTGWDGSAEITATNGQKIVIVEVDMNSKCIGAGIVSVVTAE